MSLFVLASKDGWVNIMYHGLDAVGVDQQVSASYCNLSVKYLMTQTSKYSNKFLCALFVLTLFLHNTFL